jgi:parallel beta-helix repeat protein
MRLFSVAAGVIISFGAMAQLSGTKVIGSAPSDYTTFTDAVNALTSQGISASVIFEVKSGTYNERITIGSITGASATKTITFRSQALDSSAVTLSYASSASATDNFVVYLNDADYVKFSYMTIKRTGTNNYAQVLEISNGATHNTFEYCNITGTSAASTTTFTALVGSTNALEDSYNVFQNNTFTGGSYGLNLLGRGSSMLDPGLVISNNLFKNQVYRGIYITNMDDAVISGNTIITNTANTGYYGIYGMYANNDLRILKNKLQCSTGYGIYLSNCSVSAAALILIANNFISIAGSSNNFGIYLSQVQYANVYYNSVNLTTATGGRAFYLGGAVSTGTEILNNNWVNAGGGYAVYIDPNTVTPILQCDNNNLYSSGSNLAYFQGTGNCSNLAAWHTASTYDASGISVNPQYVSATDLHVSNGALNGAGSINLNSGTPISDDIDGDSRNFMHPDIGADEFNIEDIGVCALQTDPSYCENSSATIKFYIKNYTNFPFQGTVPVYYQVNGGSVVNATTGSLFIAAHDSTYYFFATQAYLSSAGILPVVCGTNLAIDVNTANDDYTSGTLNVNPLPEANAGNDVYVCLGDSATVTATGGGTYLWNTLPPQNTATIKVLVNDTTQYIVTVTLNGCSATDTVLVIPGTFGPVNANFTWSPTDMHYYFTDASTGPTSWMWDFGDGSTSTDQNPDHIYASNGDYTVSLIAYNGCYSDTIVHIITVISVPEYDPNYQFAVSPNPASSYIEITYSGNSALSYLFISDINGRLIRKFEDGNLKRLDISGLAEGTYILTACINEIFVRKTLLIQR